MNKIEQINKATPQEKEILNIAIEELCEVAQSMTKILRFGWDSTHPEFPNGQTNREHLEEEIGDLTCMLQLLAKLGRIEESAIMSAAENKLQKLSKYSNIDLDSI